MSSISVCTKESYPGRSFSIPQLLYATKRKMQSVASGGRVTATTTRVEVTALQGDALEVLSLLRSMENDFASINRIPPDVLSLVPDYWNDGHRDKDTIKLTHVCRGWRELFKSRPSLWNRLDCVDVGKTHAYLERSKSSPLEISLNREGGKPRSSYRGDALRLVVPHIDRVRSLIVTAVVEDVLPDITAHFSRSASLLEHLSIMIKCYHAPVLSPALFNGDLSSLQTLELQGLTTDLPWNTLPNLTSFFLNNISRDKISVAVLLAFFECAPLLRNVSLEYSLPAPSDTPPKRVVTLPCLERFTVTDSFPHSTLLDHLSIPPSAFTRMAFHITSDQVPIQNHHPKSLANFKNLYNITQANVGLRGKSKFIQLYGPSGHHFAHGEWTGGPSCPAAVNVQMLQSVLMFDTSRVERLTVTQYAVSPQATGEGSPPYNVLNRMVNLRVLTLTECHNLPFFVALNPEKTPGGVILCPWLTELTLHVHLEARFCIGELCEMASARASRGVGLQSVTVICMQQIKPPREVFRLRQYVSNVRYQLEDVFPDWNVVIPVVWGPRDVK